MTSMCTFHGIMDVQNATPYAMCIGQEKILKDGQLCAATLRDRDIAGDLQVTKTAMGIYFV
ncbi:hypothetical protein M405DRAFT_817982, partial [Rhizopogon salebrosus TDB-379]